MSDGVRRLLLDSSPGERRGVVLLDGRPERLLIERDGEPARAELGARLVGRLGAAAGGRAFVDLPFGPPGAVRLPAGAPAQGTAVDVEVVAEAAGGKGPRLRWFGMSDGAPRMLIPAPPLRQRLQALATDVAIEGGEAAREVADLAQEAALEVAHRFRGGLTLHIEPARALVGVDIDLAAGEGAGPKRLREANLSAIRHAVRLLRLKALGGVAALDLLGFPDPQLRGLYRAEAERALAPDGPECAVGAPDRFGLLHLSRPHRERPLTELLCDPDGRVSARTVAQTLARQALRSAAADPGGRIWMHAASDVIAALCPLLGELGPRFSVVQDVAAHREDAHVRTA